MQINRATCQNPQPNFKGITFVRVSIPFKEREFDKELYKVCDDIWGEIKEPDFLNQGIETIGQMATREDPLYHVFYGLKIPKNLKEVETAFRAKIENLQKKYPQNIGFQHIDTEDIALQAESKNLINSIKEKVPF